eukprot:4842883-Prymnesium_polylepis.1
MGTRLRKGAHEGPKWESGSLRRGRVREVRGGSRHQTKWNGMQQGRGLGRMASSLRTSLSSTSSTFSRALATF